MMDICSIQIEQEIEPRLFDKFMGYLAPQKQLKVRKLRHMKDKRRSIIGDMLIRKMLCNHLQCKNEALVFDTNPYGKPYLAKEQGVKFNLSHAGDWVVAAVSSLEVGIDVEQIKPIEMDIAKRFFTKDEYLELMTVNEKDRIILFYKLWTLKESYVKMIGKGLTIPFNTFSISLEHGIVLNHIKQTHISLNTEFIDKTHLFSISSYEQSGKKYPVELSYSQLEL